MQIINVQVVSRIYLRGYNLTGKVFILHIKNLGSSPSTSIAQIAQLAEHNIEAIMVISSNLILSKGSDGIGRHK
jgi:hypothetical protein